ncbi:hypothetical protein D1AOALGA4SA_12417 [Olavius algarvensis Delta 1 endosymbiont]|nr:hypothetical protein D1AOALGA4SA_12417 [Olavius algarvensis Delta 1 endosymbiont]
MVMPHTPFLWGPSADSSEDHIGNRVTGALPSDRQRASDPEHLKPSVSYTMLSTKRP